MGILIAIGIVLVCAGATVFFLTKPPDYERHYRQGQHELAHGQYAFAVRSLEQALAAHPQDGKIYLALARAYVGVDQIDKAWQCIGAAQQLGQSVATEPALASDLANYYRQHQQWGRAAELLRPLASAGVPGKRAELADLDALWGDECIAGGNLDQALQCWQEVRALGEGTRISEVDSRLATIYQRFANNLVAASDDNKALDYLNKLNAIAPSAANLLKVAEIFERQGRLELAIDQLRKASKMGSKDSLVDRKLAMLMVKRGKELLDKGDTQAGFGYLQEAKNYDPQSSVPSVAMRNVSVGVSPGSHEPYLSGDVWNPGPGPIMSLPARIELYDTATDRSLWDRELRVIDEFEPPLPATGTKPVHVLAPVPVKENGMTEFRVYLAGALYKTYPIGGRTSEGAAAARQAATRQSNHVSAESDEGSPTTPSESAPIPTPSPGATGAPASNPSRAPALRGPIMPAPGGAEDKTLKDLEP